MPRKKTPSPTAVPHHIAIVMDGNGRWARQRGMPRPVGHRYGVAALRRTCEACDARGVRVLTAYAFSSENWKRPRTEVRALMSLFERSIRKEIDELDQRGVRFMISGRLHELPEPVLRAFTEAIERTAPNAGLTLNLALNYGGRREIADAVRAIAERVARGEIAPEAIDEELVTQHLYTAGLPDPDLVIRTGGDMRVSNFLLWQAAYAEYWVTPALWPDFDEALLDEALRAFASRERRFGGVVGQKGAASPGAADPVEGS